MRFLKIRGKESLTMPFSGTHRREGKRIW